MNTKLADLEEFMETARQVCLGAMDCRSVYAAEMANIYFTALHDYRVELRRQRMKEKIVMQAGKYQASDYNEGLTDWRHGAVITPKGESK